MTHVNQVLPEISMVSCSDDSVMGNPNIENFWKLEAIGISDPCITDDDKALEQSNLSKNGRYQVQWPWKCKNLDIDNLDIAIGRLRSLARHFD